ncbi:alpha/beta hydrolase [Dyadobacter flavalbus]|uniref:Alpha/beta hydrolase n=1 Tax=Dyadobacter flavalbus TaxID=2579942 RepID=A0A5M8QTV3_9BACT|nr:alpha/beta hydrolase [Dyadobacter flavalbus]KAA6438056.1 alpha/beta hydrolase [Dyadobacter flavalbus]
MKTIFKSYLSLSMLLISITSAAAQSTIADSTMAQITQERTFYETLGKIYPPESSVTVNETTIAGVKSYWFNENLIRQKHIVVYLHGGVYALGSINSYRAMISHLAKTLGLPILYVEYSLAPERPFPAAKNEIFGVYSSLREKYPDHQFTVIGDSAGGGLAITLVHDCMDSNVALPNSLALISPWVDLKTKNNSYVTRQALDPILSKKMLHDHALLYAPDDLKEADPSELKFKQFPPVIILVGTDEVLNDDSKNFYGYIQPIQAKSKLKEFQGQKHVWLISNIGSKESVEAMNDIKEFISTETF